MSIGLIVERAENDGERISLDQWQRLVASHADLRIRDEPYIGINPKSGETIRIEAGVADAEICVDGEWLPLFLRFMRGRLVTEYRDDFDEPDDPQRRKIAAIAKELNAVIRTDVDDEPLDW